MPDFQMIQANRSMDIHSHHAELLSLVMKHEGDPSCYLFTNESYLYTDHRNPAWQLGVGSHRVRVTIQCEGGPRSAYFWVRNLGPRREDVRIESA